MPGLSSRSRPVELNVPPGSGWIAVVHGHARMSEGIDDPTGFDAATTTTTTTPPGTETAHRQLVVDNVSPDRFVTITNKPTTGDGHCPPSVGP